MTLAQDMAGEERDGKKVEKKSKKELTKGDGCGILRKRSRDRAENRSQERQALCKLNNTMKTRNPEIN